MRCYIGVNQRCLDFNGTFDRQETLAIFQYHPFLFAILDLRANIMLDGTLRSKKSHAPLAMGWQLCR